MGPAIVSCGGSTVTTSVAGPGDVRCQTTVAASTPTVPPDGGPVTFTVSSARDCIWTASSEAAWIHLNATSGQGDASLVGTVDRNEQATPRSGAVVVNDQRATVSQEPRPCTYELRTGRTRLGHQGGPGSVELATMSDCAWTAASSAAWLRVLTTSGTGSAAIEFEVASNDGAARNASLTVGDQRLVVEQEAAPPPCSFTIRPTARNVGAPGGDERFDVDTQAGCEWSASAGAAWVSVRGGRRTGPGEVVYSVQTNPTASVRSTTISAGGQTHSVTQAAAVRTCSYAVDPASRHIGAAGGEGRFMVRAEAACQWSASSGAGWIAVNTGGNYGSGTAEVIYVVQPNTSTAPRSATISVGDQTHTVTQAAATTLLTR